MPPPQHPHHQPSPIPGGPPSFPPSPQAGGWHPAQPVKHHPTPGTGHVRVSGPWNRFSRLCPLSRQHPRARARGAPRLAAPPPPGPPLTHSTWEHSPCMSSLSPQGRGLRGGGSALPLAWGWGGVGLQGWGVGSQRAPSFFPCPWGQERPQPPSQSTRWFTDTARDQLRECSTLAPIIGETEARSGAVSCLAPPGKSQV